MKILIDIGHPGHVHLFRPFMVEMQNRGHKIVATYREKEFEKELLTNICNNAVSFGRHYHTLIGKLFGLIKYNLKMLVTILKFRPDVVLSHGSMYAAQMSWLTFRPHISLEDTFNHEQVMLYAPFSAAVLTGDYEHPIVGKRELRFKAYHESFYLHPNWFKPNPEILEKYNIDKTKKFAIFRFVSWTATHDMGQNGLSLESKRNAIQEISKYANIYISSEKELPDEFKKYAFNIDPNDMHQLMAYSSLLYGESGTMASEAALLGVPSVYIDKVGRYYNRDQENKYQLVRNFTDSVDDQNLSIQAACEFLKGTFDERIKLGKAKLLAETIDATSFLIWYVLGWPKSHDEFISNKHCQDQFKTINMNEFKKNFRK